MKFYDRHDELNLLKKADEQKSVHSIMTLIIGRRRIGKTTLALNVNKEHLYFFVSRKEEKLLCEEFCEELKNKGFELFGKFERFEDLFKYIVQLSKHTPLTLIIDEFQDFYKVNPSIFSSMQKIWDLNKDSTHLHLIICGSIYSLMKKIFENQKEPLFGRADYKLNLAPFKVETLKEILTDHNAYNPKNLLDFYIITGGVAKYIELLVLYGAFEFETIINEIISPFSLFLDEGKNRLIEEFGKDYHTYFSILSLIASSKTSKSEIESILEKNISGYLDRLEKDYHIIKPFKPINAKPNSKLQKYEIIDNFLNFWFRFIYKYQSYVESENFDSLKRIILRDFNTYRGIFLEKMFIEVLKSKFATIGSYWKKGNKNQIDIVGVDDQNKKLFIAEVKLNPEKADLKLLKQKSKKLLGSYNNYKPEYKILSFDNIEELL